MRQAAMREEIRTEAPRLRPDGPRSVGRPERPTRAPGVELVGELRESAFKDRQWLVQRDGHLVQVSELLYRVLELADGGRTLEEIAAGVTETTDWIVTPDHVQQAIEAKLAPRGLVAGSDGSTAPPAQDRTPSPLAVNLRVRLLGPRALDLITGVLRVLYAPPALIAVLLAITIAHGWLYFVHGVGESLRAALYTPGALLLALVALPLAALFHELGHAAALRYGGGRARSVGAGFYLVYPVFYTDATDSYRLGRWARVRTGLGGLYFHLIFALGIIGLAVASGHESLLFIVLLINLGVAYELLPFVRLDGYWVLADLTGIPDFFSQMGPFARSLAPGRAEPGGKLPPLKPWARAIFAAYIVATIPVLALLSVLIVGGAPYLISTAWDALLYQVGAFAAARRAGDALVIVASAAQVVLLAMPLAGICLILTILGRRLLRAIWRWSRPTPARRVAGVLATGAIVTLVAWAWAPQLPSAVGAPAGAAELPGLQSFEVGGRTHVRTPVAYPQTPPVGGAHAPQWQNCGFYSVPVADENAVHSLEHGAVWITYRPDLAPGQVEALRQLARGQGHVLVSPFPGLDAPVVASAWGRQLRLDSPDDPRLDEFVRVFQLGPQAPERGGPCADGVGEPEA